jgi:hypothetical protein
VQGKRGKKMLPLFVSPAVVRDQVPCFCIEDPYRVHSFSYFFYFVEIFLLILKLCLSPTRIVAVLCFRLLAYSGNWRTAYFIS